MVKEMQEETIEAKNITYVESCDYGDIYSFVCPDCEFEYVILTDGESIECECGYKYEVEINVSAVKKK